MSKGGMGNLMKQAQMMQANLKKAQDELATIDVEGSASNGLVKVTMSCKNEIKKINIDPSLLDDKEILEDNESRLRKTFKNHTNWSNMRNSQKPVGNHLRFIFCKLTNKTSHIGHTVRFGNYTCKKYYIPDCIIITD